MKYLMIRSSLVAAAVMLVLAGAASAAPEPQTSPRMERAKDFIADEQWLRAIEFLKAATADQKEKNKDEALFWLAHSQHQAGDLVDAVATVAELEQKFPASRWVKPARSLRVELAQKLHRADVLWWTATAPPPPTPAAAPPALPFMPVEGGRPRGRAPRAAPATTAAPPPQPGGAIPGPTAKEPMVPPRPAAVGGRRTMPPPTASTVWVSEFTTADTDLRIQALSSLLPTDAPRVIPILKEIALESGNPGEASRAVFVLASSGRPEAHSTVLEVAKRGSESVRVAAVRDLGRFGGARMAEELLQVYQIGNPRVKYQIVSSLGECSAAGALMRIVQSETDVNLRNAAIVTLGQAGGREQLQRLYVRATPDAKVPIIRGLFKARADAELIEIARREKDVVIRGAVHERLRLLGTPKAKEYLEKTQTSR
jgi:hypothetical protein